MKSGISSSFFDRAIRPQDDLFRHVNGAWLRDFEIPADRASDGVGYGLFEQAQDQVRAIIEGADQSPEGRKISDLFASFMDVAAIEEKGARPIAADLAKALAVKDSQEFQKLLADLESKGHGGLFSAFVTTDYMSADENILYLSQSGLSLPDEAYYREDQYAPIREAFLNHVTTMFGIVGLSDGAEHARRILAIETQIAAQHWDAVKDRDVTSTYNKFSRAELEKLSEGLDWTLYLAASQTPERVLESVIVREPDFFTGIGSLLREFDQPAWSSWLTWQILSGSAPYLHDALVQENFNFNGTTLSGTPELRQRWKRGVSLVEGAMGEAVGRIYVDRHFSLEAKKSMEALVANLVAAYRKSISELDWMSQETKDKALQKLNKFTAKIGFPDKWRDYDALAIDATDLNGNMERIARFSRDYELAKIGSPVDKAEWYLTPQTVNAYYNPGMNEIVFPAAILQPPFFTFDAEPAANYGGIGAIIGHEIGHGFDDQGSKYDGDGNLSDWWSDSDRAEFDKRAQVLIAQYDQLSPEATPDITVNGALTVGENIGDLGGLSIALQAYHLALGGAAAPVVDGLSGNTRFFFAWAQGWRGKVRPEALRRLIATDPHSPNEFRVNQIVRNIDAYYSTFEVGPADAMYLEPSQRVRIW